MKLLLDEMFPAAVAEGLRRQGVDVIAIQETLPLRGLPDRGVFVAAQLERRCLVTENIGDFVRVEAAWRSEHDAPHCGLILAAPAFPSAPSTGRRSAVVRVDDGGRERVGRSGYRDLAPTRTPLRAAGTEDQLRTWLRNRRRKTSSGHVRHDSPLLGWLTV